MTLTQLAAKYGANKIAIITDVYEALLAARRHEPLRVLEIGVQGGGSLRMWREWLPAAELFGIDIDDACRAHAGDRCQVHILDQARESDLRHFLDLTGGQFDFIIDDGGHSMTQQLTSFAVLFPALAAGGLYAIEDVGTSYFRELGGRDLDEPGTTIAMLKSPLIDAVNHRDTTAAAAAETGHTSAVNPARAARLRRDIAALHLYHSLAVIEKR
jgi:predicted O-methyltransferase YrrM